MSFLKHDWEFITDYKYNNIRDSNFNVIYSNVDDYPTAKIIHRSREMYELMSKLVNLDNPEMIPEILNQMRVLKHEIDSKPKSYV